MTEIAALSLSYPCLPHIMCLIKMLWTEHTRKRPSSSNQKKTSKLSGKNSCQIWSKRFHSVAEFNYVLPFVYHSIWGMGKSMLHPGALPGSQNASLPKNTCSLCVGKTSKTYKIKRTDNWLGERIGQSKSGYVKFGCIKIRCYRSTDCEKTLKTPLPNVWRRKTLLFRLHGPVIQYLIHRSMSTISKASSTMLVVPAIFVGKLCWMKMLFPILHIPSAKFLHRGFSFSHKGMRNKWEKTLNGRTVNSKQTQRPACDDTA